MKPDAPDIPTPDAAAAAPPAPRGWRALLHSRGGWALADQAVVSLGNLSDEVQTGDEIILDVRALTEASRFRDISFALRKGEILGLAGLVGAGLAGLGAARALHDRGIGVTVLEGRDRIGGRVHTTASRMDLGAHWIHGTEGNPVTNLARELGVPTLFVGGDSSYSGGWDQLLFLDPREGSLDREATLTETRYADLRSAEPHVIAGLLSDTNTITNPTLRRDAQRRILATDLEARLESLTRLQRSYAGTFAGVKAAPAASAPAAVPPAPARDSPRRG